MVQQAAPAKTLQTLEGIIRAYICSGDQQCVWSQVQLRAHVDDDGSWFVSYWNPMNPAINANAGGTEQCEADALRRMFDAIASLSIPQP